MSHWTLEQIPWQQFDAAKITTDDLALVKAACMVEHNGDEYARYLCEVFRDDAEFCATAVVWAKEEVQHGMALRRWIEMADPEFDFNQSFSMFTEGHQLPSNVEESVRGSRCGELIARCVVETGTSTYYTAIKERTEEPVLKAICAKIAADEFRHYQLFHTYLKQYQKTDHINLLRRAAIAWGRVAEIEDNELAFAFFSAHQQGQLGVYDQQTFTRNYMAYVGQLYTKTHIDRMSAMVLKVIGLRPQGWFVRRLNHLIWHFWRSHTSALKAQLASA